MDEELYYSGNTVVWSHSGLDGVCAVIKTFTMDSVVQQVCVFIIQCVLYYQFVSIYVFLLLFFFIGFMFDIFNKKECISSHEWFNICT